MHTNRSASHFAVSILLSAIVFIFAGIASAQEEGGAEGSGEERQTKKASAIDAKTFEKFAKAQEFMEADDYQGALRVLDEIKSKDNLSSAEALQLYNFYGSLYYSMERYQDSIKAFETILTLPDIEERQRTETMYYIAQLRFTIEDWQGAIDIMLDWLKSVENPPPEPFILLGSAYYQLEKFPEMIEAVEQAMVIARERDKPVKESWWLLLRAGYYATDDIPNVVRVLEVLVVEWPKKDYWVMLSGMYGELNMEAKQLAAYEAAYDQELLNQGKELVALSQLLMQGEAAYKAALILEKGFDAGLVEKTVANYRLLSQAWQVAAEYDKAIPPLKEAAAISDDGELDVRLANSYLNLSRYDECEKSARAGLDKGGLDRPGKAYELLGMCLVEKDEFEAAKKALRQAAKDEKIEKRARNWIKFIETEQQRIDQLNRSIAEARKAREARQARIAREAAEAAAGT